MQIDREGGSQTGSGQGRYGLSAGQCGRLHPGDDQTGFRGAGKPTRRPEVRLRGVLLAQRI